MDFKIGINKPKVIMIAIIVLITGVALAYFRNQGAKEREANVKENEKQIESIKKDIEQKVADLNLSLTDIPVVDKDGQSVNLTDIRGDKALAVYFTSPDKLTLESDLPIFQKLFDEMKEEVNFALIVMDSGAEEQKALVNQIVEKGGITVPVYTSSDNQAILSKYAITDLPARLITDKEGKIKGLIAGSGQVTETDFRELIESNK